MFQCSKCGRVMKPLFTTFYCAVCDPPSAKKPQNSHIQKWWKPISKDSKYLYLILKEGDVIPPETRGGWHCTRKFPSARPSAPSSLLETDEELIARVSREWGSSDGGWEIRTYYEPGSTFSPIRDTDLLIATKPKS